MNAHPLHTYLMAQGELGGFEVVIPLSLQLSEPLSEPRFTGLKDSQDFSNDLLWKSAGSLSDFYGALKKHSIYTKAMRSISFCAPEEIKTNAPLLLFIYSPQELTAEARDILERLFKKLDIDLKPCAISFIFKCNEIANSREKPILTEMLRKEIELINPGKIIFFRESPRPEKIESPAKISERPIAFAGKPAITLYSLLEMLPSKPNVREKGNEVLSICKGFLAHSSL